MGGETDQAPAVAQVHIQLESAFEYSAYKAGDSTASMVCRLVAPEHDNDDARPAVDIVAVFDVSGSMSGEKLKLAVETLQFVIANLKASDRFGLVTFDTGVYSNLALRWTKQASSRPKPLSAAYEPDQAPTSRAACLRVSR